MLQVTPNCEPLVVSNVNWILLLRASEDTLKRIPAVGGIFVECKQAEMNELVTREIFTNRFLFSIASFGQSVTVNYCNYAGGMLRDTLRTR